jgi:hypothetical protein
LPPPLSTPVEGSRRSGNSLQIGGFCPRPTRCYAGRRAGSGRT